jgi:hypothetical protein
VNLQKKFDNLTSSFEKTKEEIIILNIKLVDLQNNNLINNRDTCTKELDISDINTIESHILNNDEFISETKSIICDELCDLNNNIPRIHMETMNYKLDGSVDSEFVESLFLDYTHLEDFESKKYNTEISSCCDSEKGSIKSYNIDGRSRNGSITDINWGDLTKKFFFG